MATSSKEKRVTVRMDPQKVDELDDLIIQRKADGDIPRDVNRSDLIRRQVDELIEDLES